MRNELLSETRAFGCLRNPESIITIVGVPYDSSSSYRPGSRFAPQSIRDAACNIELNSVLTGIDLELVGFNDIGDLAVTLGDGEKTLNTLTNVVSSVLNEKRILSIIGGEHTITYGVLRAFKEDVGYLVVDAHLDLREDYLGYRYSHASFNKLIVEELGLNPLYIGVRAWSSEESSYAKKRGLKVISSELFEDRSISEIVNEVRQLLKHVDKAYISIDFDAFDPSYAPGVSNPEPLGITPRKLLKVLKELILSNELRVAGFDVVEVNPLKDPSDITSILAAKMIVEMSSLELARSTLNTA